MIVGRRLSLAITTAVGALCALLAVPASANANVGTLQVVAGARVSAIADRIAHELADRADRTVAPAYRIDDQALPAGAVAIAAAGSPFVSASYVSIPVAIRVDGRLARTIVAGYRVTTYVQSAAAAHDLSPGTVIAASDLIMTRLASNGRPTVAVDALIGRKLNAATPKGAPLYVEQTIANTVVKAGLAAILVVHDGPVALMADVIARTGGAVGDVVTVFNQQTGKAIAATVTGPNRVEVTLPGGEQQ